ncbi:peptidase [Methylophaga frappieri]|nr:peptidase [Methylophaga frappieri]
MAVQQQALTSNALMKILASSLLKWLLLLMTGLLIVFWLGSAILLNHQSFLGLDKVKISTAWLKQHYQVGELQADKAYVLAGHVIVGVNEKLYVNAQPLLNLPRPLVGAVALEDLLVLATDDALILLNKEGEYLDTLGAAAGIPPQIQNIGVHYSEPVLQTYTGMWRGNFLLDQWELMSLQGVSWSQPETMSSASRKAMEVQLYGDGIPINRVLTDLHTGQLFNGIARFFIDVWLLLLIVIAFHGMFGLAGKFQRR